MLFQKGFKGVPRVFQVSFKEVKEVSRVFRASFKEVFKESLKHINSLSKKVGFVVVVCQSSQLPEQKEGLFSKGPGEMASVCCNRMWKAGPPSPILAN